MASAAQVAQRRPPGPMLVSHRYRFIYTKTRKTAGYSVESYFEPFCMPGGEWTQDEFREEYVLATGIIGFRGEAAEQRGARWWNHMPAWLIRKRLGEDTWRSYFKFCVIRNPFEKAISAFYWRRKGQEVQWTDHDPQLFEDWLERSRPPRDRNIFCIGGRFALDDIIRHETLAPDVQRICRRLSLPWKPELLPAFKTGIRPPEATAQRLYTPRSRRLVREAYRFELRCLAISFPKREARLICMGQASGGG